MDFDVIICFEIHAELSTKTKLFCRCPVSYDAGPNENICPVCTGQPGTLPALNRKAVEYCIRAGLALNCNISSRSIFARKNYFYPDLPKGYQISQYEYPLCEDGYLEIPGDDGKPYVVGIKRIHLEEDAGKLVHSGGTFETSEYSLVDYNRAGVPLIEIVADHTKNPIRSLQEARSYLGKVRQILQHIGVSDCAIEQGQFRCDVNVSLRPVKSMDFNERVEIKNMASFKSIIEAIKYEIKRQSEVIESGGEISQETRLFDEVKMVTIPMRSKEDAPDYRYFPDPDLVELDIDRDFVRKIKDDMPELPGIRLDRFIKEFGISEEDAHLIIGKRELSDYFESCVPYCTDLKKLGTWITNELIKTLNENSISIKKCPVAPKDFARLITLISKNNITEKIGRLVFKDMFETGGTPDSIIEEKGLKPIQETDILEKMVEEVMKENPNVVSRIKDGKRESVNFLIGKIMKKTRGRADAKKVSALILKKV